MKLSRCTQADVARLSLLCSGALACAAMGCTNAELFAWRGDPYALDSIDRSPAAEGGARCHPEALIGYRGTWLTLTPSARVAEAVGARLERFEAELVQLGTEVYGRPPSGLLHVGTYACRSVDLQSRLSEHALGN